MLTIITLGLLASLDIVGDIGPAQQDKGRLTVQRPEWCRTVAAAAAAPPGTPAAPAAPGTVKDDPHAKAAPARCGNGRLQVPRPKVGPN